MSQKTKGFVTIATGKRKYRELAKNLLYSYKKYANGLYPFAIITDTEDDITAEFDDVVVINDAKSSYLDKLLINRYTPYDDTIFIDADSLVYANINSWWDMFENADDVSVFGECLDITSDKGWFYYEGIGEYKDQVSFIPSFCGGVYFLRKSDVCNRVFELAKYFEEHFCEFAFQKQYTAPADEPVFALAMAICNCRPVDYGSIIVNPAVIRLKTDTDAPLASYRRLKEKPFDGDLVHWSTFKTELAYYKREIRRMRSGMPRGRVLVFIDKCIFLISCIGDIPKWIKIIYKKRKKIPGKLKRMLKKLLGK